MEAGLPDGLFAKFFWRTLEYKILVNFMAIWYILWQHGIFYITLVLFVVI
jgi:hypothetical protein